MNKCISKWIVSLLPEMCQHSVHTLTVIHNVCELPCCYKGALLEVLNGFLCVELWLYRIEHHRMKTLILLDLITKKMFFFLYSILFY